MPAIPVSLVPGARLGPYEIVGPLGAGGMGEVYRATDTILGRQVAIKVLPAAVAADPERLARFDREARTLAALNHPNIAAIYGVEQTSEMRALVLELVEGETLADRIARGQIPIDEALPIARQIADALEAAHEHGIIHRDLKPANIKLRPDGTVKVLDFGLAKLVETSAPATSAASLSPTITSPALMTGVGVLLGTAAYMSPEQAKGRPADRRCDIWAFGCVLYEMLTGTRAFEGDDVGDTLAAVLRSDPPWQPLPEDTPASIRRLLRRSLEKDPRRRLADVGSARLDLDDAMAGGEDARGSRPPSSSRGVPITAVAALVALAVLATSGAAALLTTRYRGASNRPVTRLTITPPPSAAPRLPPANSRDIMLTRDGSRLVYVSASAEGAQLHVRPLGSLNVAPIGPLGTSRNNPFAAPDGRWVGFFEGDSLMKLPLAGGSPSVICPVDGPSRGASWSADGTIVYATVASASGLWRVSAEGGTPVMLTKPDPQRQEGDHLWPHVLPGGRHVLFTIVPRSRALSEAAVAVLDVETGRYEVLAQGTDPRYVSTGHIVYANGGTLYASAFDLERLELSGPPVRIEADVTTTGLGAAQFDVGDDGTLVFRSGGVQTGRTLVWVDRSGREERIDVPPHEYQYPRLSPDGTRIAIDAFDQEQDIWLWDIQRLALRRLTSEPERETYPVWTPDGGRLTFGGQAASDGRQSNLFVQGADGSTPAERLARSGRTQYPYSFSPDGRRLVFREDHDSQDLMMLTLGASSQVQPLVATRFNERNGEVSPDGKWLAYESDESGQFAVYVRRFADPTGAVYPVSAGGGTRPLWSRDASELFYFSSEGFLMRVHVRAEREWNASTPDRLLEAKYFAGQGTGSVGRTYDISADGRRFLMLKESAPLDPAASPGIVVVSNWFDELRRLTSSD